MFGMSTMSDAVSPLKDVEGFKRVLTSFSNPLLGFLVGILFTMTIQSSAGTIGVLQALSLSVKIKYDVAIPVVIGAEVVPVSQLSSHPSVPTRTVRELPSCICISMS
nr:hypothetical protein [Butyrivibrio sp. FCS014]